MWIRIKLNMVFIGICLYIDTSRIKTGTNDEFKIDY